MSAPAGPVKTEEAPRQRRIHLIEDDPDIALMSQTQLALDGFQVTTARDGVTALGILEESPPDLVLLDLRMPGCDGFEVLAAISEDGHLKGVPVLILTNYGEPDMVERGLALGATNYLVKARTTPVELARRVRAALEVTVH